MTMYVGSLLALAIGSLRGFDSDSDGSVADQFPCEASDADRCQLCRWLSRAIKSSADVDSFLETRVAMPKKSPNMVLRRAELGEKGTQPVGPNTGYITLGTSQPH